MTSFVKASVVAIALCSAEAIVTARSALAASPGEQGGVGSGSGAAPIQCERSFVYSKVKQGCVRASSGFLDDSELYEQGRALALSGSYANALDALRAIRNKRDARALTMIGYAERKLGNTDRGISAYQEALAIDPNNADAREYLGEAYVTMGRSDLAKLELEAIEAICGSRTCEQYQDLAAAIVREADGSW